MDLYETLGVARDATKDTIRKAFRRKAKAAHPDAGGSPETFHALTLAHSVLTDDEKRQRYDETGEADDRSDTTESQAMSILGALVERFADDPDARHKDLVAEMRKSIQADINTAKRNRGEGEKYAERAADLAKRFKGSAILKRMMEGRAEQARTAIRSLDHQIAIREKALSLLDGVEFEADERQVGLQGSWVSSHAANTMGYGLFGTRGL